MANDTWDQITVEIGKYKLKEQSYPITANNLLRVFGDALLGISYQVVVDKVTEFFRTNKKNFYSYFEVILPELRKTHDVVLVTTNSQMVAQVVVEMFGLDGFLSTQFEVIDEKFTGRIISTLADGKKVVENLIGEYGSRSMAVGDSENDIGMLEKVDIPVCINPSEELLVVAQRNNWKIVSDQTAANEILSLINSKRYVINNT